MIGNEEDFTASLGFEVEGIDHNLTNIETDAFKRMIENAVKEYKNFQVAATTLRGVITASKNDWSAICWHDGKFYESRQFPAWPSSIASAAATASPADWLSGFSSTMIPSSPSITVRPTGRWLRPRRETPRWLHARK